MTFLIRAEQPSDISEIHQIHLRAFPEPLEAKLVDQLRDNGHLFVSLVAEIDGVIVGHIAFSPVTIDGHPDLTSGVGLAPLAVLLEYQRKGIGSQLVQEGLVACSQKGFSFAVVLGSPKLYQLAGFRSASHWQLGNEYGAGDEFMAIELIAESLTNRSGLVRYAPEFSPFA
jgi:putative acetyltransferase